MNIRHHPSFGIELQDLHAALNRVLTSPIFIKQYKLCLFIDGLDEFDGDYWKLSKAIYSWAATDNIKFCISSRPHNELMTIFASDPSRYIRLPELTRQDIFNFVRSEFQGDELSAAIRAEASTYFRPIRDIVERADGNFLWAHLVTHETLKAIGNHSSSVQLDERWDHTPQSLAGSSRLAKGEPLVPESSTPAPSTAPFVDSGYESMGGWQGNNMVLETCREDAASSLVMSDDDGTATVYSEAESIRGKFDNYMPYIVQKLSELFPTSLVPSDASRLYSTVPDVLKVFADQLGYCDSSAAHRQLRWFIRSHSIGITTALIHRLIPSESDLEEDTPRPLDGGMSVDEKTSFWFDRDEQEPTDYNEATDENEPFEYLDQEGDNEADKVNQYLEVIVRSPAYSWLASTLATEFQLQVVGEDIRMAIRHQIIDALSPAKRVVTRREATPTVMMVFKISCAIMSFFELQQYGIPPHDALPLVLVLCGSGNNVQATTCADYMAQTWPFYGPALLGLFQDLLRLGKGNIQSCTLLDNTRIDASLDAINDATEGFSEELLITVTGSVHSVAEIGEAVAWLQAALSFSGTENSICACIPILEPALLSDGPRNSAQSGISGQKLYMIRTDFEPLGSVPLIGHKADDDGNCWRNILGNTVSVKGYPTRCRPQQQTGMEISLDTMIALANARRLSLFGGKFCIKGFCSVIVPTQRQDNIVYWHLLTNLDGEHLSYTDERVLACGRTYPWGLRVEDLKTSRHILGWCTEVHNLTGSNGPNYSIRPSRLQRPQSGFALDRVTISAGMYVTAAASAKIGTRDKAIHIHARDDYYRILDFIVTRFVVFYDSEDRRAWLVDGASALLHLVRASLLHLKEGVLKNVVIHDKNGGEYNLQESAAPYTGRPAAIDVFTNKDNENLILYEKRTEFIIEETRDENGVFQRNEKRNIQFYRFRDKVEEIWNVLEQIIAHQADVSSDDGVGIRIERSPRRRIEGFDFFDVATCQDPIFPRFVNIKERGRGWIDMTRALHTITLFGRGFGDLIRPAELSGDCRNCSLNVNAPKGKDNLAACIPDLEYISKHWGNRTSGGWRLVEDIYWYIPDKLFEACECKKPPMRTHDRIQVLLPSKFPGLRSKRLKIPTSLPERGAVLFGHSRLFPLRWKDHGLPKRVSEENNPGKAEDEPLEVEAFHDSGLGTSLGSSSMDMIGRPSRSIVRGRSGALERGLAVSTDGASRATSAATIASASQSMYNTDSQVWTEAQGSQLGSDLASVEENGIGRQSGTKWPVSLRGKMLKWRGNLRVKMLKWKSKLGDRKDKEQGS